MARPSSEAGASLVSGPARRASNSPSAETSSRSSRICSLAPQGVALDPFTGAIAQGCLRSSGNREQHILIALVRAVFRHKSRLRVGDKIVEGVARHIDNGIAGQAAALDLQEPSPLTWACDALAAQPPEPALRRGNRSGWRCPAAGLAATFRGVPFVTSFWGCGAARSGARRRAMSKRRAAAGRGPRHPARVIVWTGTSTG